MDETIQKYINEFTEFWRIKSDEHDFWKALAISYIEQDFKMDKAHKFITQISFYPKLIETLVRVLKKMKEEKKVEINLEITFFSTLLPRHYWNFPVMYKNNNDIHSIAVDFLDDYRAQIHNCIQENGEISVNIKRILFLAQDSSIKTYKGESRLFLYKEFEKDFHYYCPEKAIKRKWKEIIAEKQEKLTSLEEYLFDMDTATLIGNIKNEDPSKQRWQDEYLYLLTNKQKKGRLSVGDYYINQLHSKDTEENARYIVVCNKLAMERGTLRKKGYCLEENLPSISPDLSYIKITTKETDGNPISTSYILDTYMDIKQGIVKLQVIKDDEKAKVMSEAIHKIIGLSMPIKNKYTHPKRKSENIDRNQAIKILNDWKKTLPGASGVVETVLKLIEKPKYSAELIKIVNGSQGSYELVASQLKNIENKL
ncbi:hypothetical protein [uncultured Parabacteroides sp.]|uniref:hypothetical protein n=1 Tax=uncultured Parabacteroides sp. TaxID=512312 RepID=UPI00262124E0|nr:hypothetical protein [uncultured Parabacteroides sp.]